MERGGENKAEGERKIGQGASGKRGERGYKNKEILCKRYPIRIYCQPLFLEPNC